MQDDKRIKISNLNELIKSCKKCPLHLSRTNVVLGNGNINTKIMLIGEAPGRNEDLEGIPFVGLAGKLLDSLLNENNIKRDEVYITNVVKCRPPNNRTPNKEEVSSCLPYLIEEINIVKPELILTLGRTAGEAISIIFNYEWEGLEKERKKIREVMFNGTKIKILSTYHPAAALYKPELKELLRDDIKTASKIIGNKHKNLIDFM
ncbi:uracil-DNA glycosylase [Caldisphaera lagunensis]|nr:uracil-DNA glycosylase [Caldisphaera lagunensis]